MHVQDWRTPYLTRLLAELPAFPFPLRTGLPSSIYPLAHCTIAVDSTTPDSAQVSAATKRPNREAPLRSMQDQLLSAPRLLLLGEAGAGKSTLLNLLCARLCLTALPGRLKKTRLDLEPQFVKRLLIQPVEPWYALRDLLPVRLSTEELLADDQAHPTNPPLQQVIARQLASFGLAGFTQAVFEVLEQQGGLLIMDGLDILGTHPTHHEQITVLLTEFSERYPRCRVILASQTRPEIKPFIPPPGYKTVRLAAFNQDQIALFLEGWFSPGWLATDLSDHDLHHRKNDLAAQIGDDANLRQLATNPSRLAMLCSLATWRNDPLPVCAEQLLIRTCQLLQEQWLVSLENCQGLLSDLKQTTPQALPSLLARCAWQLHQRQPGSTRLLRADWLAALSSLFPDSQLDPKQLDPAIIATCGLLSVKSIPQSIPQSVQSVPESVAAFFHPQWVTCLAAQHAYKHATPTSLLERWRDMPAQGDELLRLVATLAYLDMPAHGWEWISHLCTLGDKSSIAQAAAHLAGNLACRVFPRLGGAAPQNLLEPLQQSLLRVLQMGDLPAAARAESGDDLAQLGDPRFDPQAWHLPTEPLLGFVEVPSGSFCLGTDEKDIPAMLEQWGFGPDWEGQVQPIEIMQQWYKREIPQHSLYLERYFISRYPVTVAQYRTFAQESGYQPAYPECLERPANHPLWNVNFSDALAYCQWLEDKLKTWDKTPQLLTRLLREEGWRLTIPSEAEWEKAARGEALPPWLYPWGADFDPDKANLSETGLGKPTSVGCFPRGASPYGLLDLCGNVWEWTRSRWGKDPNQPEFGYPYCADDGREQIIYDETLELRTLRGASCNNYQRYARCATRRAPLPVYRSSLRGFRLVLVGWTKSS